MLVILKELAFKFAVDGKISFKIPQNDNLIRLAMNNTWEYLEAYAQILDSCLPRDCSLFTEGLVLKEKYFLVQNIFLPN